MSSLCYIWKQCYLHLPSIRHLCREARCLQPLVLTKFHTKGHMPCVCEPRSHTHTWTLTELAAMRQSQCHLILCEAFIWKCPHLESLDSHCSEVSHSVCLHAILWHLHLCDVRPTFHFIVSPSRLNRSIGTFPNGLLCMKQPRLSAQALTVHFHCASSAEQSPPRSLF